MVPLSKFNRSKARGGVKRPTLSRQDGVHARLLRRQAKKKLKETPKRRVKHCSGTECISRTCAGDKTRNERKDDDARYGVDTEERENERRAASTSECK